MKTGRTEGHAAMEIGSRNYTPVRVCVRASVLKFVGSF